MVSILAILKFVTGCLFYIHRVSLPLFSLPADAASNDTADIMREIAPSVKVLDFPEAKPSLLDLLAKNRSVFALPGESLGVTDTVNCGL